MKKLIYKYILRPLIERNYRFREEGNLPDEWYWADRLAMRMGYYVEVSMIKGLITMGFRAESTYGVSPSERESLK